MTGVRPTLGIEGTESQPVLLLEYIKGNSLSELIHGATVDLWQKLQLAVNIAGVLERIHEQQVMHKDISSSNIIIADNGNSDTGEDVYIIDFGLASTVNHERPDRLEPDDSLVGTLAYISPEQTGRMNRQVDYRTDIYSYGVVLYELFTGKLPFNTGDSLELIHAQIAKEPQSLHKIDTNIPEQISNITLKLLAKNAEDRYQTMRGLKNDLKNCLEQWQLNKNVKSFKLGRDDYTGRLQIPQKLYGRPTEIKQLKSVLENSIQGSPMLQLVAGYSGVGKTALVQEIEKDVIAQKAIFVEDKFDQLQRTVPGVPTLKNRSLMKQKTMLKRRKLHLLNSSKV